MNFTPNLESIRVKEQYIQLYLPAPREVHDAYIHNKINFPFWAQVWPSAQALAAFILDHPEIIENKKVLELGAGLGLPSIVAARWAASVVCSDHEPAAIEYAALSARYHQLKNVSTRLLDWTHFPADLDIDVLLLSDINYEPASFELQQELILSLLKKNIIILLTTPQRLMAKSFVTPLMKYCRYQEEINIRHTEKEVIISLFMF